MRNEPAGKGTRMYVVSLKLHDRMISRAKAETKATGKRRNVSALVEDAFNLYLTSALPVAAVGSTKTGDKTTKRNGKGKEQRSGSGRKKGRG